jgi:uncharacterized protein (TIGR03118 family)
MKSLDHTARACAALALAFALAATPALAQVRAGQRDHGFRFDQTNLASDGFVTAKHTDPNLVNSWGLAFNPFGLAWVADADGHVSTLYDGDGNPNALVVQIPTPTDPTGGSPTGIVFNGSGFFLVAPNQPARFIFATEEGVIAAWAPAVDLTHAKVMANNSASGASYRGLALSAGGSGQLLYASDFFHAKVDVFDSAFKSVTLPAGAFTDPGIPKGFAPFGIQAIAGNIYVTYAKQDPSMLEDETGPGLGYVDVYTPNGKLIRRVASRGVLNAPWGVTMAPAKFGRFSNALLIGNFGDGRINGFEPVFGVPLGALRDRHFKPIEIDGLWGLAFGNGFLNQPVNTLFFTAGPDDEEHGLYGRLDLIE